MRQDRRAFPPRFAQYAMLSYRHAFHAGNHADVLKHAIVVQLLEHLAQKDKAFWYIDTHAGAGLYALDHAYAQKKAEFETGISRLWQAAARGTVLPPMLEEYLDQVRALNPDGNLRHYPGSPWLAWEILREHDRLRLFELHSTEIQVLRDNFRGAGRRVMLYDGDGFTGIKAILPPPPRRGLVLIDPSYEDKQDYARTVQTMRDGLERFATGIYAVWYPQVQRRESVQLPVQLKKLAARQPDGQAPRRRRPGPAWQRHVHRQPAVEAEGIAGGRHAGAEGPAGAGRRRGVRAGGAGGLTVPRIQVRAARRKR